MGELRAGSPLGGPTIKLQGVARGHQDRHTRV